MRREFFILANANEMQRSSATPNGMSERQKGKCRIQAANGKIVLTRLRTDSLDVSATNGKLEITGDCSRASLNSVNGKVLFEGTCSEYLTAKSVNGSVKLHLPHDLADASIHASTTTGKIRLVSNGRTESYTKTFTRSGISAFTIQASTVNGNVLLSDLPAEN